MDYETARQVFFQPAPEDTRTPYPVTHASPARRLRDACEPLAMHAVWCRRTNERLAALGLNFLTGYVFGRAACLGDVPSTLVVAAFAAFEPGLVTTLYDEARSIVSREELLAARDEETIDSLQDILSNLDVLDAVNALRRGLAVADGTGRTMFSGLKARPWPENPYGQLWRACDLVREHRGDSHIAAYLTTGFNPLEMNILTELYVGMPLGSYTATRGWSAEAIATSAEQLQKKGYIENGALTLAGNHLRAEIEEGTDDMEQPLVDAIGKDFHSLIAQLNEWSRLCIKAGAFPPSELKRAAG